MCSDYELDIHVGSFIEEMQTMVGYSAVVCTAAATSPTVSPRSHVRIGDVGVILSAVEQQLRVDILPWGWEQRGHPLFNLDVEGRSFARIRRGSFANHRRCLILATGFYDYTAPPEPQGKWRDQHLVKLKHHRWFWIAGIMRYGAFSMLTKKARSEVQLFCRPQICILPPSEGIEWLQPVPSTATLLRNTPQQLLERSTLRKNSQVKPPRDGTKGADLPQLSD
jgi:putative SOS response-associated peptidase YedK